MNTLTGLKKTLIWAGLIAVLVLASACGQQDAPPAEEEAEEEAEAEPEEAAEPEPAEEMATRPDLSGLSVKFSSEQPHTINTTFFRMMDNLEEWGADVEVIFHAGGTFGIATVLAGEVDVAENDTDELMLGIAQGAEVTAFMTNTARMDYVLVTTTDITSVTDLVDKDIGMSGPGGFDTLLGRVAMEREGLEATDANFVQIGGSGDRTAALAAEQIDAATVFVDNWLELQEIEEVSDNLHALIFMADIVPGITKGVYYASDEWLAANPEMALGIACGQLDANAWFLNNQAEWISTALEDVEGATEGAVSATYDILADIEMFPADGGFDPDGIQALMDILIETGDLEEPIPVEQVMDRSFLDQALEMGCGQ